ncbi:HDIG domain-containing metalloprotein [Peptococcaceae bacterium 1198_IL3148]
MVPLNKVGGTVVQGLKYLVKHRRVRRGSAAVFFLLIFTLMLYLDFFPSKVDLKAGEVAPYDVTAPRSAEYVDTVKTAELKQQAAEAVDDVYTVDLNVILDVKTDIDHLTENIIQIKENPDLTEGEKLENLKPVLPFTLPDNAMKEIILGATDDLNKVAENINKLISDRMQQGITDEQLPQAESEILADIEKLNYNNSYKQYAVALAKEFLRSNRFYNEEQTNLLREQAMDAVEPVTIPIKANQKVVKAGDIVTQQDIQELQALGLLQKKLPWTNLLGSLLLIATLMSAVLFYLRQQNKEIYHNISQLYLLGIVALIVILFAKVLAAIEISRWPEFSDLFGYLAPVAAAGMLTAILLESRLAVLMVAVISLFVGMMNGNNLNFSMAGFLGGVTGVYSVSKLSQRGDLARAGLYTGLATMLVILMIGLIEDTTWQLMLAAATILGLTNGLLSSILTNGALPYLESTFGITSSVKLLELSNPSHPLLRKMLLEVPGTYHHSIMVGNLAEAATEAVGGDSLLVRVGALYHDIGKIKRPYFFIENQMSGDNPHDKIAPNLSTLILTSHVKDGGDMAREHKLPQRVIDIIEQHHGTTLARFFYNKALEGEHAETIKEDDFRYDGPKPQTKEAAIVMLADSVEAAVRAQNNPTSGQIEGLVRKLIKGKLMDEQLDECDLTLKDLDKIGNAFLKVLSGMYHSRIEYPDIKEMERRKSRRANNRK